MTRPCDPVGAPELRVKNLLTGVAQVSTMTYMTNTDLHPVHASYVEALSSAIEATRTALMAVPHPIAWHNQQLAVRAALDSLHEAHALADALLADMAGS